MLNFGKQCWYAHVNLLRAETSLSAASLFTKQQKSRLMNPGQNCDFSAIYLPLTQILISGHFFLFTPINAVPCPFQSQPRVLELKYPSP